LGSFIAPTLVEIDKVADVDHEVFGPVLHVLRYDAARRDALVDEINATGYGLTFGIHSRVDATVARVIRSVRAGNIYMNRNMIGAVVGMQPFGGSGLSGTGPKASGPHYMTRLAAMPVGEASDGLDGGPAPDLAHRLVEWVRAHDRLADVAESCRRYVVQSPFATRQTLPGPVGESNVYTLRPRGRVGIVPASETGLLVQLAACLSTGNRAVVESGANVRVIPGLPDEIARSIDIVDAFSDSARLGAILFEGPADDLRDLAKRVADWEGALVVIHAATTEGLARGTDRYPLQLLMEEQVVSTNTAAVGGNPNLTLIG
jgi:RHH-type proline utilization regulon transcriptional repressor/proline dehydrogenase/delta 1-pyrroline-5-carboxylate dehydrogenase